MRNRTAQFVEGLRHGLAAAAFALCFLLGTAAWAGEIKFSAKAIEVDDQGKITAGSRSAAITTVESVPGEDEWVVYMWAKLDKPAVGPLYVEFWDKWEGKPIKVGYRHEEPDFQGDPYLNTEMTLPGGSGFNKDRTYTVVITQVSDKGKDLTLAKATLKLVKSAKEPEESKGDEGDGKEEDEQSAQDALDSFAPGGEGGGGGDGDGGPPPVEGPEKKRGCAVAGDVAGPSGAATLLVVIAWASRGRRSRARGPG